MADAIEDKKKSHRERKAGRKAEKKKAKNPHVQEQDAKQRNPKAFAVQSVLKAQKRFHRAQDLETKKQHIPLVDRTPVEPPPIVVAIVGPPKVGKSTLLQALIKNFTRQNITSIQGPVTLVSGKKRRITLIECNNDINSMIDIAKVADLILLLIDASFGFEMEIFEFLNICQVHGMPRIMGVLTHLDMFKNNKQLKNTKKVLKHRFWTEVYQGAKLFYLSGLIHGSYPKHEIKNLGRFISVMKFRPLLWRSSHPYVLVDRIEDITPPARVHENAKCNRKVCLYGYVRGVHLMNHCSVHIAGCGDHRLSDVSFLPDPCPLPDKLKKRSLIDKEKLIYAPMSGVGGIIYDKDSIYIELGGSHSHTAKEEDGSDPKTELISSIMKLQEPMDAKMSKSQVQVFSSGDKTLQLTADDDGRPTEELVQDEASGRMRRKAVFSDGLDEEVDDDDAEDDAEDDDEEEEQPEEGESEVDDDAEDEEEDEAAEEEDEAAEEIVLRPIEKKGAVPKEVLAFDESDEDESTSQKPKEPKLKKLTATAKLKKELAEFLDVDESEDDEFDEIETTIEGKVDGQFTKGGIVYDMHDVDEAESVGGSEDEDEQPTKKKRKAAKGAQPKKDKDLEVHLRVKSTLRMLDSQKKAEEMDDEADEDGDDDGEDNVELKWKENLAQKASEAFYLRQTTKGSLRKLVYGVVEAEEEDSADEGSEDDENNHLGGLFRIASDKKRRSKSIHSAKDQVDSSKFVVERLQDWKLESVIDSIRDCFVTGKWKEAEDAENLLELDDMDAMDEDGDFEDMETGHVHKSKGVASKPTGADAAADEDVDEEEEDAEVSRKKIWEKKKKLKEQFNAEYDEEGESKGRSYYDDLKQEMDQQAQMNKSEFDGMDDELRVQYEGFRPGMYVRMEIEDVPCELVLNFNPLYPLIVGALLSGEENIGFVQARIKKHRWQRRILKTRDPLIFSLGWRRFQSLPIYSIQDHNGRNRQLKYTPEHLHCMASFWGPLTPQGTGFLAVQSVSDVSSGFRIAATGTILDLDKSSQVMKKLKLVGTPFQIYKKTAFIEGMFSSTLEVAKFEGASIRTVSGIRGQIKKAIRSPEGAFRATFEDKIKLSDIAFVRTWYRVDVPEFYTAVTSLLLPANEKNKWVGMKTLGQLKWERNIRNEVNSDHLYTPIERKPRAPIPLVIPRALQMALPYRDRPKVKQADPTPGSLRAVKSQRPAVVLEPREQKVAKLMSMLKTRYEDRQERKHVEAVKNLAAHRAEVEKTVERQMRHQKEARRQVSRLLSRSEAIKEAKARKGGGGSGAGGRGFKRKR